MRTLEQFRNEMLLTMQRLGDSPSLADVEAAGRDLVKGGIPEGADLEGMLLLRDLARARESAHGDANDHDDPET